MRVGASVEYQRALISRLRQPEAVKAFIETRNRMGVGSNVGLGSLPLAHGVYSAAMLAHIYKSRGGSYTYPLSGLFPDWIGLSPGEAGELLVVPPRPASVFAWPRLSIRQIKQSYTLWLVSVYQNKGYWDPHPAEESRLLDVTDKVLTGLFAHEFAHYVEKFVGLQDSTKSVLASWHRGMKDVFVAEEIPIGAGAETEVDLIAASMGFKEEILAKNQYTMDCVATYVEPTAPQGLYVRPSEALSQLKYRNEQVALLAS